MSQLKENILLIIVKIVYGLKKMKKGYEVVCDCLKVGEHSRASLLTPFQNSSPNYQGDDICPS